MLTIEILLIGLNILYVMAILTLKSPGKWFVDYLPVASFAFLISILMLHEPLWTLYPVYFSTAMSFAVSLTRILAYKEKGHKEIPYANKKMTSSLFSSALILSLLLYALFPVLNVPKPEGDYNVGTQTFELTDADRLESYGPYTERFRRITVQVWYPADHVDGLDSEHWFPDGRIIPDILAERTGIPHFLLGHTTRMKTNSYPQAVMSNRQAAYPVIILSHGWSGVRSLHVDIAEAFASNGYIVFAIDHSYGAIGTVLSTGEVLSIDESALPDRSLGEPFFLAAEKLIHTYAGDILFLIDTLEAINDGLFGLEVAQKLSLDHLGLIGHSTGGGAGVEAAIKDSRIKAIFGLDAWLEAVDVTQPLTIPSAFLRSEHWHIHENNAPLKALRDNSLTPYNIFEIEGSTHIDFTLTYMLSRLTRVIDYTGKINRHDYQQAQNEVLLAFFNRVFIDNTLPDLRDIADKWPLIKNAESFLP